MSRRRPVPFTPEEIEEIERRYPHEQTKYIAESLGRPIQSVFDRARRMGLRKSESFFNSELSGRRLPGTTVGAHGRFKKGNVPWNKGLKTGVHENTRKCWFKKGNRPQTWVPIGTEVVDFDGFLKRKITDTGVSKKDWVFVHRELWEKHNGKIPKNRVVCFKDGNRSNITIENLELVSRQELMKRNTIHRYPPEIIGLCRINASLKKAINKKEKHEQH